MNRSAPVNHTLSSSQNPLLNGNETLAVTLCGYTPMVQNPKLKLFPTKSTSEITTRLLHSSCHRASLATNPTPSYFRVLLGLPLLRRLPSPIAYRPLTKLSVQPVNSSVGVPDVPRKEVVLYHIARWYARLRVGDTVCSSYSTHTTCDGGTVLPEIFAATSANGSVSICNTSRASALVSSYPIYRRVIDSHSSSLIIL
jgi:hypothetical protein